MFTKSLWQRVGGYPPQHLNEDAAFFHRIHSLLGQSFVSYPLVSEDRFFVLRGKSKYKHMCMNGGENPLNLIPGNFELEPCSIADMLLRQQTEQLILTRQKNKQAQATDASPTISICVVLKNRSRIYVEGQTLELFPNCVRSLAHAAEDLSDLGRIELIVVDFHSDDWPLREWLDQVAESLKVHVVTISGRFSKGKGINIAIENATSDYIFLCDADMLVTSQAIRRAVELIDSGKAWCPTYECLDRKGRHEFWQDLSHGMVAMHRNWYTAVGPVPEFESWGGEDDLFHDALAQHVSVVRERSPHLKHQWHPESSRHKYYANPRQSDYWKHMIMLKAEAWMKEEPIRRFYGIHPHWEGEVQCFSNGRMIRPGIDSGSYMLSSERIILNWDRWAAETLDWDHDMQVYFDTLRIFRLQPIVSLTEFDSRRTSSENTTSLPEVEQQGLTAPVDLAGNDTPECRISLDYRLASPEVDGCRYHKFPESTIGDKSTMTISSPVMKLFDAKHPHWQDELCLFVDGRMKRAEGDGGRYLLEDGKRLLLQWDRWAEEELFWNENEREYCTSDHAFTLREVSQDALRINFVNFWPGFHADTFWHCLQLKNQVGGYRVSGFPQLVFESVFGPCGVGRKRWPGALQVWYTGENVTPPLGEFDFCLSFHRDCQDPQHLRWPFFLPHLRTLGLNIDALLTDQNLSRTVEKRPRFCAFIATNGGCSIRNQFVERLTEYRRVDCPGSVLNNMPGDVIGPRGDYQSKITFLKQYKFVVCFENSSSRGQEGYVTEKLVDAMLAGCIPLYWGDHRVGEDFNVKSFVNLGLYGDDVEAMCQLVIRIDQDEMLCQRMAAEPWLADNIIPWHLRDERVREFFQQVLSRAVMIGISI